VRSTSKQPYIKNRARTGRQLLSATVSKEIRRFQNSSHTNPSKTHRYMIQTIKKEKEKVQ